MMRQNLSKSLLQAPAASGELDSMFLLSTCVISLIVLVVQAQHQLSA
jgi:hypothetical protein